MFSVDPATCSAWSAGLHEIGSDGKKSEAPLAITPVDPATGRYAFKSLRSLGVPKDFTSQPTRYVVEISGCGSSFERSITDRKGQDVSAASDLIAKGFKLLQLESKTLANVDSAAYVNLLAKVESQVNKNRNDVYLSLKNEVELRDQFVNAFGFLPDNLGFIDPAVTVPGISGTAEGSALTFAVTASHWNTAYVPAAEWYLDNVLVGTSLSGSSNLGKNWQGSRTLKVRIGHSNGGTPDATHPIEERMFPVGIADTYPAVSPSISLVGSAKRNVTAGTLMMNTGAAFENCETFSSLALTESPLVPPLNPLDYNLTCQTAGTETLSFNLSNPDGPKTLALWTRDSAGNISATASTIALILDRVAPTLTLADMTGALSGGGTVNINWSAADSLAGLANVNLEFSADGMSYTPLFDLSAASSPQAWVTPAINTTSARLRLTATDQAGNTASVVTAPFEIDSSPPVTTIAAPTALTPALNGITISGLCENGYPITINGSGITATTGTCVSGTYSQAVNFTSGDGTKTVTVAQTDSVGNVSTDSRDFIRDTTPPVLSFSSPAANTVAAATIVITGVCEDGLSIALAGSGLGSPSSTTCSSGAFSQTINFSAGDGAKTISLTQTDAVGNSTTVSRDFVRSSSGPAFNLTGPAANTPGQNGVTLTGICDDAYGIVLSGSGLASPTSAVCSGGVFSQVITFTSGDGTKTIRAQQTNAIGNVTFVDRDFIKDSTAPVLAISAPAANTSAKTSLTVTGTCETGLTVSLSGAGLDSPATTVCSASAFSVTVSFTAGDGAKAITFSQTDLAGNTGSVSRTFIRDNVGAVLAVTSPADNTSVKSGSQILGTCEADGSAVTLSGASLTAPITVACSGGAFDTGAFILNGADGVKTLSIAQQDAAGNVGTLTWNLIKDNVAPLLTKTLPADGSSSQTGATITGTCESGYSVYASGAGVSGTPSDLCVAGAFSLSATFTAGEGTKAVTLTQTDSASNSATLNFNLIRDNTAPVLAISSPAASTVAETGLTVTGTCETGLTVQLSGSGHSSPASVSCTGGAFSVAVVFSAGDGSKPITFTQTDAAGNATSVSRTFMRDDTDPVLTITSPAIGAAVQASVILEGACEAGLPIQYGGTGINSAFSGSCVGGTYSQQVFLKTDSDGSKVISVTQTDAIGNSTTVSRTFVRDNVAPVITQTTRSFPHYTNANSASFGGACEAGISITIKRGGTVEGTTTCAAGTWSYPVNSQSVDATYAYTAEQTDQATNVGSAPFQMIRDTVQPSLAITGGANQITASNSVTISGTCEAGLPSPVTVSGAATGTATCSAGSWTYTTPSVSTDAVRTYNFTLTDQAGNSTQVSTTWERNTNVPNLLVSTPNPIIGTGDNASVVGTCEAGLSIEVRVDGNLDGTIPCPGGSFTYTTGAQSTDANREIVLKQTNALSLSTTASIRWIRDNAPPVFTAGQMSINSGSATTTRPRVNIRLQAVDALTNITHFCLKTDQTTTPVSSANCWVSVASGSVGLTPNPTLNLTTYGYNLPITPGSYFVNAWVKDAAGNISALTNAGAGTGGRDSDDITLIQSIPPTVNTIIVGSNDSPANPPTTSDLTAAVGAPIYIKWRATDNLALPSTAMSVYFTSDDTTWTLVANNLVNGSNGGCTVNHAGTTADDTATGCYRLSASPVSGYIKFRVIAKDSDGLEAGASSSGMNVGTIIRFLAGNTDPGTNLSAQSSMFFYRRMSEDAYTPDPATLNVARDGTIYFKDAVRGILKIDPADGIVRVLLPVTGSTTGDGGPVASATARHIYKLTIDSYQPTQRLWVYDYNRIRRIDLATGIITTVIGGGTDNSDNVANPLSALVDPYHWDAEGWAPYAMFVATPNGDFYFQGGNDGYYDYNTRPSVNLNRIRKYDAATGQLSSWRPNSVTSAKDLPEGDYRHCHVFGTTFGFSPSDSSITTRMAMVRMHPTYPGCEVNHHTTSPAAFDASGATLPIGNHPWPVRSDLGTSWANDRYRFRTGLDGKIYSIDKADISNGISRYEGAPTFGWTKILGPANNLPGSCPDNTDALSCNTVVADVFVDEGGTVFFLDDGLIRTITQTGKVITLMGQAQVSGVGHLAVNARLGSRMMHFRVRNDGGIVFADPAHSRMYELDPVGNMFHLAGIGYSGAAALGVPAHTTPINIENPHSTGETFGLDPATGEIYHNAGGMRIAKMTRASSAIGAVGTWTSFLGYGTNAWSHPSADGTNDIRFDGDMSYGFGTQTEYRNPQSWIYPRTLGFSDGRLLVSSTNLAFYLNGVNAPFDNMIKSYDTVTGIQSHLIGKSGFNTVTGDLYEGISPVGTPLNAVEFWAAEAHRTANPVHLGNNRWLFGRIVHGGRKQIFDATIGGTLQILTTLDQPFWSFAYRKHNSDEYIYYCSSDNNRIRRRHVQTNIEVSLPWPVEKMSCDGMTLHYRSSTQSLIFAYKLNGLVGFAEYIDPM